MVKVWVLYSEVMWVSILTRFTEQRSAFLCRKTATSDMQVAILWFFCLFVWGKPKRWGKHGSCLLIIRFILSCLISLSLAFSSYLKIKKENVILSFRFFGVWTDSPFTQWPLVSVVSVRLGRVRLLKWPFHNSCNTQEVKLQTSWYVRWSARTRGGKLLAGVWLANFYKVVHHCDE